MKTILDTFLNIPINSIYDFLIFLLVLFVMLSMCIITTRGITICHILYEFKHIFSIHDIIGNAFIDGTLSITIGFFNGVLQIAKIILMSLGCVVIVALKVAFAYYFAMLPMVAMSLLLNEVNIHIPAIILYNISALALIYLFLGEEGRENLKNMFNCY